MEIKFKKLVPEAQIPTKSHEYDAGFDFYCTSIEYEPNGGYYKYHTGIALEIPNNIVGLAFPRSSIIKTQLMLKNSVGVIDPTYRGEIVFMFTNITEMITIEMMTIENFLNKFYQIGERIGQLVFLEIPKINLIEANELSETERGTGGFGSTNI